MKKISILILSLLIASSVFGCAKVDVEKAPVLIKDTVDDSGNLNSEDLISEDSISEESNADSSESVKLTILVEGMEETIDGKLFASDLGYNMVYDTERFTYSNEEGIDSFMATNPDPEIYPYVYLNISRIDNTTFSEYKKQLEDSLTTGYTSVESYNDVMVSGTYNAVQFKAITGKEWNSAIRNYYIIESGSSIYLIEMQYFVEAAEGFGSRMTSMLNTFTIR